MNIFRIKTILISFLLMSVFPASTLYGQRCSEKDVYRKCESPDDSYESSGRSRSITMYPGKIKQVVFTVYENREYFLSLCADKKVKNLQMRIRETNENQDILYDNAAYEFEGTLTMTIESTKKLMIEIILPPEAVPSKRRQTMCVGLLVEYMKL